MISINKILVCIKSLFYKVDIGLIDAGAVSVSTNCDFSVYTVEILDDELDSVINIKTFSSFEEARIYGINLDWNYPKEMDK